ncbi:hypothetical protein JOM56_011780 [Amanita muscaria]
MVSIQEATVLALLVQAILYGFYLMLVMLTLRWLIFDDRGWKLRGNINGTMISTAILFFVFSTSNLSLSLLMSIVAMRGQTTAYNRYGIVNNMIENTTILMADAVLIYRCWVVYGKSWRVVIAPVLLWLAALSCSVLVICSQLIVGWESGFYRLWVVFYCSNILTNVYATGAIIYRIFKAANHRQSGLHKISRTLFESGFLYTLTSSMNLVSSIVVAPPIMRYISDAINFSMTGITFNLIIIRVRQQRYDYVADTRNSTATPHPSGLKFPSHTSELSPTTTTSNDESYIKDQSRASTTLDLECGSNGISTYNSSSNDSSIRYANPMTAEY